MSDSGSEKNTHSGHRERLKSRFLESGLDSFNELNTLELILFFTIPRGDTNPLAHALLDEFGSLEAVLDAPYEELLKVKGIGEKSAQLIKLFPGTFKKYSCAKSAVPNKSCSTETTAEYLFGFFADKKTENLAVLCYDARGTFRKCSVIAQGDFNTAEIDFRRIAGEILKHDAVRVVLAHNHPNGVVKPSFADVDTTRNIVVILKRLNVAVADHIIIGGREYYSMRSDSKYEQMFV
ncbi:MAG: hypothetical protein GX051_04485 [Clostridiales bacterium]|nr:hypothetical protein [Clostridiales bacterium]